MVDNSSLDDIPGTTVFTIDRSHKGFALNQFCMSLMKPENRERFKANERSYLEEWPLTEDADPGRDRPRLQPDARPRREHLLPVEDLRYRRA